VLLQVGRELGDGHAIDACPFVALDLLQRLQQIATLDNSFHRGPAAAGRSRQAFAARISDSWVAALRASPAPPVPKFSVT